MSDNQYQQFGGYESPAEKAYTEAPEIPAHLIDDSLPIPEPKKEEVRAENFPEEPENEIAEEDGHKKPKKYDSIRQRLSEAQREKFQYQHALTELQRENEQLRASADLSSQAAMLHYEEGVAERLEKARQFKLQALESGDLQAQVDADIQMQAATTDAINLNNWKAQQALLEQQTQNPGYDEEAYYNTMREQQAVNWISQNGEWLHPQSPNYDAWMADQLDAYCEKFDNNLFRNGLDHAMYTPEYFQVLDNHVNALKHNRRGNGYGRRELSMRSSGSAVSPVRGAHSAQSEYTGQPNYRKLSADEKEIVRILKNAGLNASEKGYLSKREKETRETPYRRGYYGPGGSSR